MPSNERILEALSFEEYRGLNAVSRSTLSTLLTKSAAHARYELDHPKEQTPDMLLGQAVHCAVLEPDVFKARFACRDLDGRTVAGKAQAAKIQAEGLVPLNRQDYNACLGMEKAVSDHPVAGEMLATSKTEISLQWEDGGVACKARLDAWAPGVGAWDLKTTQDARPDAFQRTLFYQSYFIQAAFYLRGAAACGLKVKQFLFVVVEREAPYGIRVYRIEDAVIQAADRQIDLALKTWATCQETGVWPGYDESISDIGIPQYAWKELE